MPAGPLPERKRGGAGLPAACRLTGGVPGMPAASVCLKPHSTLYLLRTGTCVYVLHPKEMLTRVHLYLLMGAQGAVEPYTRKTLSSNELAPTAAVTFRGGLRGWPAMSREMLDVASTKGGGPLCAPLCTVPFSKPPPSLKFIPLDCQPISVFGTPVIAPCKAQPASQSFSRKRRWSPPSSSSEEADAACWRASETL